jgi:hypothetical protein
MLRIAVELIANLRRLGRDGGRIDTGHWRRHLHRPDVRV